MSHPDLNAPRLRRTVLRRWSGAGALLVVGALLGVASVSAQEDDRPVAALNVASIQSAMATLKGRSDLDEAVKSAAVESYEQALAQIALAREHAARQEEFERSAAGAAGLLKEIREKLSSARSAPPVQAPEGASVAAIEQLRASAEADLAAQREQISKLQAESTRRASRQAAASEQIARSNTAIEELLNALKAEPAEGVAPELSEARRVQRLARLRALRAEVLALQKELAGYAARRELLPARIDWALRRRSLAEETVAAWQKLAADQRRIEAERAAREADKRLREEAAQRIPQLLELAVENQKLAAARVGASGLSSELNSVGQDLTGAKDRLAALSESFLRVRRKVRAAGLTNAMGQLLRWRLEELPDTWILERRASARQERISEVQYSLIVREERRAAVGDVEYKAGELLAEIPPEDRARLDKVVRELLTTRRDLLDDLIGDSTLIFNRLVELEQTERQLIVMASEYRAYIEERILWVRSVSGGALPSLQDLGETALWLTDGSKWSMTIALTYDEIKRQPWECAAWIVLCSLLILLYPWSRRSSERAAEVVWKPGQDGFQHTLRALLLALVMSLPLPTVLWGLGWCLARPSAQIDLGIALGSGFKLTALVVLGLEFARQILRDKGLSDLHFRWRSTGVKQIRRHLRWFAPVACLATFVFQTLDATHEPTFNDSLGRCAFLFGVLALSVFLQRVLRPSGPVFHVYMQRNKGSWLERARYVWYPLAVGLPLLLAALALRGYYYTAQRLLDSLQWSLWLILALALVNALLLRWLRLTRSRLVLQQIAAQEAEAARMAAAEEAARLKEAAERLEREVAEQAAAEEAERAAAEEAERAAAEGPTSADEAQPVADDPEGDEPTPEIVFDVPDSLEIPTPAAGKTARSTGAVSRGQVTHAKILAAQDARVADTNMHLDFEEAIDHAAISTQLQRLFRAVTTLTLILGLLAIWADVLPALRRLDQVQLWPTLEYVDVTEDRREAINGGDAASEGSEGESAKSVTGDLPAAPGALPEVAASAADGIPNRVSLADLGLSIIIFVFTFLATKNVPGLLEFLFLERVALDAGARYAVSTVVRYAIVLIGVTVGFGFIGFRWDSVQWLAAALTFGLAFGLQEIFANFVSGLIILFERPASLGDWVTVEEVTGVVTRIRIRATTITDLDRRELIVPNKAFVTGNVINWALTDSVLRVVIPVGVAYGSDTKKTRELLLKIAEEHPRVLDEPPPRGLFREFGASSLDFELHVYIDHPVHRWEVRNDLLDRINAEFAAGGVEIAFPQRDLHLRSADAKLIQSLGGVPAKRGEVAEEPEDSKP